MAVRKPIAGRDALVAQAGFLELERDGRRAELQVRRAVEPRADVLQILLDVPERERQGAILWHRAGRTADDSESGAEPPTSPLVKGYSRTLAQATRWNRPGNDTLRIVQMNVSLRPLEDRDLDTIYQQVTDPESIRMAAFTAEDQTDRRAFLNRHWQGLRRAIPMHASQ